MLELMILPFVMCLVLTGIYSYLGIHIIRRQVIFVDLALAQIAALGAMTGLLLGIELHSHLAYFFSLAFTFIGAWIFTVTRMKGKRVPQEAIIGIVYVVATAASIIVLNRSPSEAEHIKHMLVGNILFVQWHDFLKVAIIAGVIGVLHYIFRDRFLSISRQDVPTKDQMPIKWWDFIFYALLGIVVTSSVEAAGVLLIFSYLVAPASCAMILSGTLKTQILIGWGIGIIASLGGLYFSAIFDFPTGASIVCTFGFVVGILGIIKSIISNRKVGK